MRQHACGLLSSARETSQLMSCFAEVLRWSLSHVGNTADLEVGCPTLVKALGEPDVQPVDQYPLYELGGALDRLRNAAFEMTSDKPGEMSSHYGALWLAQYQLSRLLSGVPFQVHFCRSAVESLLGHIDPLIAEVLETKRRANPDSAMASPTEDWRWYSIRNGITTFENQFSVELQKTATYAVPERGIFKTEGLVDSADQHIHASVHAAVSTFARNEFKAAGRCLAFGLYPASGFHSARAVEDVLRAYHRLYLPQSNSEELTMGNMASALDDMHKAKKKAPRLPSQNTVRHLKDFANYDRNPLMHKTVVLEELHAVTLLNTAASVIVEMAKEMLAAQEDTDQLPLLHENESTGPALISAPGSSDAGQPS